MKRVKVEILIPDAPGAKEDPDYAEFAQGWEDDTLSDVLTAIQGYGGRLLGVEHV